MESTLAIFLRFINLPRAVKTRLALLKTIVLDISQNAGINPRTI